MGYKVMDLTYYTLSDIRLRITLTINRLAIEAIGYVKSFLEGFKFFNFFEVFRETIAPSEGVGEGRD